MNCDDFTVWLNEHLDSRTELHLTDSVQQHIDTCHACAGQLSAWQQISLVLPNDKQVQTFRRPVKRRRNLPVAVTLLVASAACLMTMFLGLSAWNHRDATLVTAQSSTTLGTDSSSQPALPNVDDSPQESVDPSLNPSFVATDAGNWWQQVDRQEWIDSAMPTVQSMRDGVAPLGRSFVQAVTLLTRFGGARAS